MSRTIPMLMPLFLACALQAQDHTIRLRRDHQVGDRSRDTLATRETLRITLMSGPKPMQVVEHLTTLEAGMDTEVLQLKDGAITRLGLTLTRFKGVQDGEPVEGLPTGTPLVAELRGDETVFLDAAGHPLAPEVSTILGDLLKLNADPDEDDQAFGATQAKRVGDAWPLNPAFATTSLKRIGITVAPEDISGTTRLVRMVPTPQGPCQELQMEVTLRNPANVPLPPGFRTTKAVFNASLKGLIPEHPRVPVPSMSQDMSSEILGASETPGSSKTPAVACQIRASHHREGTSVRLGADSAVGSH